MLGHVCPWPETLSFVTPPQVRSLRYHGNSGLDSRGKNSLREQGCREGALQLALALLVSRRWSHEAATKQGSLVTLRSSLPHEHRPTAGFVSGKYIFVVWTHW